MPVCACACHRPIGEYATPDVRNVIAAATACSRCLPRHCPALLDGPRLVTPQADGYTDGYTDQGEGKEAL